MVRLNLRDMAIDLLIIDRDLHHYLNEPHFSTVGDFELYTFTQIWANTSGGFEDWGGSAMTRQRTYVLVPNSYVKEEECLVFFGSKFAYHAPCNEVFLKDLAEQNIEGVSNKSKYRV